MGIQQVDPPGSDSTRHDAEEIARLRAERDSLRAQLDRVGRGPGPSQQGVRRALVVLLVFLASVSFPLALSAAWSRRTLLNTDQWVKTVSPVIDHPAVIDALSRRITDEVMILVTEQRVVEQALPPQAQLLAGPLTGAISDFVNDRTNDLLSSDRFKVLWVNANRIAHAQIVSVLRDEGEVLTSDDGKVTLNLVPVINEVLARVESRGQSLVGKEINLPEISSGEVPEAARQKIEDALGVPVPPDLGEIVVYEGDRLTVAQEAVKVFDRSVILLLLASILLIAGALTLSKSKRRTLIQLGAGTLIGIVIVRRFAMYFQDQAVEMSRPENRAAARAIIDDLLRGFFSLTQLIMLLLLLLIAVALFTGPYGWAVASRRRVSAIGSTIVQSTHGGPRDEAVEWARTHRGGLQLGGGIVFALLLLFDVSWPIFFLLVALLGAYELALLRLQNSDPAAVG